MPNGNETTQDLLAAIKRERAQLDGRLGQLDDEAMLAAARDDGWTAKDVLAHLTAWEQRLLRWIERWRETGDPGRPEVGVTWAGFELNRVRTYIHDNPSRWEEDPENPSRSRRPRPRTEPAHVWVP